MERFNDGGVSFVSNRHTRPSFVKSKSLLVAITDKLCIFEHLRKETYRKINLDTEFHLT